MGKLELLPVVVGQYLEASVEVELVPDLLTGSSWLGQHRQSAACLLFGGPQ